MNRAARTPKVDPVREALAKAPIGPPITKDEQERLDAIRLRGPVPGVPHAEVMKLLEERSRRGS